MLHLTDAIKSSHKKKLMILLVFFGGSKPIVPVGIL